MTYDLEFASGRVAVITGAASGIGLATAEFCAKRGMHVALVDLRQDHLDAAVAQLSGISRVAGYCVDVKDPDAVHRAAKRIEAEFGPVSVLMANAGIQPGSKMFVADDQWRHILDVNFFGIVNTVTAFSGAMLAAGQPAKILITGSKQGITTPPGDPAYNISKAAVKTYAEALAHELRNRPDCAISVHLLIPGFVWTPLTYSGRSEKPAGAWTPHQTVEFMMAAVAQGDFYILCPDNDVTRALDEQRIAWAAGDIIANRPPLSRWHPDYAAAFTASLKPSSN